MSSKYYILYCSVLSNPIKGQVLYIFLNSGFLGQRTLIHGKFSFSEIIKNFLNFENFSFRNNCAYQRVRKLV